jgi:hypothetical protein
MNRRLARLLRSFALPIPALLLIASGVAAEPKPAVFARLNVTVTERRGAELRLPSPFTILPDEQRAAVYVPETGGVLLLHGEDVQHHFPIPTVPADGTSGLHDLDASARFLVGGRWTPGDLTTVELHVFDLETGRSVGHIESRNPHLGGEVDGDARLLWRVVVDADTVGVYDPRLGASVPLWVHGQGAVESAEQMAQVRAGIGFGRQDVWIPAANGTIQRRIGQQRFEAALLPDGVFLDGCDSLSSAIEGLDPALAFLRVQRPGAGTRFGIFLDTAGRRLFPDAPVMQIETSDGVISKNWIQGRPVRVRGSHVYWPVVGLDEIEIRRSPLDRLLPANSSSK